METKKTRNIKPEYDQFRCLMEKYFSDRIDITKQVISAFNKELKRMHLSEEIMRRIYEIFISHNYRVRVDANMSNPLYYDRNYALKIHNNIFFDLFTKHPPPSTSKSIMSYYDDPEWRVRVFTNKHLIMSILGILGNTESIFNDIDKISNSTHSVLITGETGTGKELYAKAIHYLSPARKEEFLPINCSGIPDSLLESELFGYEKGAFTDAKVSKEGLFEKVRKGTLFLDEISGMSTHLQAKLLRVLQDGDFRRLGGNKTLYFNGRIIAATNRDLRNEVKNGRFRADLFYRLNVLSLTLLPLREMDNEIKRINITSVMHERLKTQLGFATGDMFISSDDVQNCLLKYDYPGNFRELTNILIRALTLSEGKPIDMKHLPDEVVNYDKPNTVSDNNLIDKKDTLKNVKLSDIFDHADAIKSSIIKSKIEEIYESGSEIKKAIQKEMGKYFTESAYQTLNRKLTNVVGGKDKLKAIREKYKKLNRTVTH